MVRNECMLASEHFQIRRLLWDELKLSVCASEEEELRGAIGNHLIEENKELQQEVAVLAEILTEFQQQNDDIRGALGNRPHVLEPPGRPVLIEKLKLLAASIHHHLDKTTSSDMEVLDYVLSTESAYNYKAPMTPRMENLVLKPLSSDRRDGIVLRSGTTDGRRPTTSCSQQSVSRKSTISVSSRSTVVEIAELHGRLNVDEIDAIKEDLREALREERLLLLEDIDFIQGCMEMEKDLIDDDRRKVATFKPPPSLSELQKLQKTLEKSLEEQEMKQDMERVLSKANGSNSYAFIRSRFLPPVSPPEISPYIEDEHPKNARCSQLSSTSQSSSLLRSGSSTKVLKIRHIIQEVRDEPYLS